MSTIQPDDEAITAEGLEALKAELEDLETKIKRLRYRLRKAVVVEVDAASETFGFGRTAEVLDETSGATHTWTLVGPTEADLAKGMLSAESPVARALRDRAPGDQVVVETPAGERTYRVEKIVR